MFTQTLDNLKYFFWSQWLQFNEFELYIYHRNVHYTCYVCKKNRDCLYIYQKKKIITIIIHYKLGYDFVAKSDISTGAYMK